MINGKQLTINEAHQLLKSRQVSSCELTRAALDQIQKVEPNVKAMVTVTEELALKQAKQADERIAHGDGSPLNGIPALIKYITVHPRAAVIRPIEPYHVNIPCPVHSDRGARRIICALSRDHLSRRPST